MSCARPARFRGRSPAARRALPRGRRITSPIRRSRKPYPQQSYPRQQYPQPPRRTGQCRSQPPGTRAADAGRRRIRERAARAGRAEAELSAAPADRARQPCRIAPRPTARRAIERAAPARTAQPYPPQSDPQQSYPPRGAEQVPLGRERAPVTTGAVAVQPTATLACPIVSALDTWFASGVQPAAMKWFGVQVAEIRQISAYSCRGMNGQRGRADLRACIRQCARHRVVHARGRPQDHRQGRLARRAGGAGLPARRAGLGLPALLDRARARLERVPLRPHPRGPDAARERAAGVQSGAGPGRCGGGTRRLSLCARRARRDRLDQAGAQRRASASFAGATRSTTACRARCRARTESGDICRGIYIFARNRAACQFASCRR